MPSRPAHALVVITALLLLGACRGPAPPEAAPAPPPPAPAPTVQGCLPPRTVGPAGVTAQLTAPPGPAVAAGTCAARVDEGAVTVTFSLPAAYPDQVLRDALRYSAPQPPLVHVRRYEGASSIDLEWAPGAAGERISLRLAGPLGQGGAPVEPGFELEQVPTPRIALEQQRPDGSWQPVAPGSTLPRAPLTLCFRFPERLPAAAVAEPARQVPRVRQTQVDTTSLTVAVPEPPPQLWFQFDGLSTLDGVELRENDYVLYTGEPPQLVRLDLRSGLERPLGPGPVDVYNRILSPDGRRALLFTYAPNQKYRAQIWLLDLASGRLTLTGMECSPFGQATGNVHWLADRVVVGTPWQVQIWHVTEGRLERQPSQATNWVALAPDGRWLAGFAVDMSREDDNWLAPGTVVLHDLATGEERTATDAARVMAPHSEAAFELPMAWDDGGHSLLLAENVSRNRQERRWLRLDPERLTVQSAPDYRAGREQPHDSWVAGPDGLAYQETIWGPVKVRDAAGAERQWGEGLALGWAPDGDLLLLRWANAAQRRPVMGM